MELNPGKSDPPEGVGVVHVRAVGSDDTLHFLFCSHHAPALILVHTNTTSSNVNINWTVFNYSNYTGGLKVVPESSVQFSSALVFTKVSGLVQYRFWVNLLKTHDRQPIPNLNAFCQSQWIVPYLGKFIKTIHRHKMNQQRGGHITFQASKNDRRMNLTITLSILMAHLWGLIVFCLFHCYYLM